jgi:hypothetical protein
VRSAREPALEVSVFAGLRTSEEIRPWKAASLSSLRPRPRAPVRAIVNAPGKPGNGGRRSEDPETVRSGTARAAPLLPERDPLERGMRKDARDHGQIVNVIASLRFVALGLAGSRLQVCTQTCWPGTSEGSLPLAM